MAFRIMTYNIFSGRNLHADGAVDIPAYGERIRAAGPDAVILNEVRGDTTAVSPWGQTEALQHAGGLPYRAFAHGIAPAELGPYGNAILSAFPILTHRRIEIPDPPKEVRIGTGHYESRVILAVDILLPQGTPITVFGTHFGLNPDEKAAALTTVTDLLDACPNPWIFGGDLNMDQDHDGIRTLTARYRDAAAVHGNPQPTHPSDQAVKRIDYLFVSDHWTVTDVSVPDDAISDHLAVIADLTLGRPR